jgi:hypothetical protein
VEHVLFLELLQVQFLDQVEQVPFLELLQQV